MKPASWGTQGRPLCSRGTINRFDQRDASPAVTAVADRRRITLNGVNEVFEQRLMTAEVAHYGRGRTLIRIGHGSFAETRRRVSQVGGENAIVLENDGSFCSRHFHSPRISRIRGCSRLKDAEGSA